MANKKKIAVGQDVDMAKMFTFSAATQIQNQPPDADGWSSIVSDLERALKAAQRVADALAEADDSEGK